MIDFGQIRQLVNIRQAAGMYGLEVNRFGSARCIFHGDNHPSMRLYHKLDDLPRSIINAAALFRFVLIIRKKVLVEINDCIFTSAAGMTIEVIEDTLNIHIELYPVAKCGSVKEFL